MNQRGTVLIFGEDHNDREALRHLVRALIPAERIAAIRPQRRPIVLSRGAGPRARRSMNDDIAAFARAERRRADRVIIVVHRDCDDVEPQHVRETQDIVNSLRALNVENVVPATPAWEIESWWMLFPHAVAAVCSCWRAIDYGNQHVGSFVNAKERLRRDLRPGRSQARCPDYQEAHGIQIAMELVRHAGHLERATARSDSFLDFRSRLLQAFE